VTSGQVVAASINTEIQSGNPNAHAEVNVINMAARILSDELSRGIRRRLEFCLFVNTRPCPKCTDAIADTQIFNVCFLWDNEYKLAIAESILRAKEDDLARKGIHRTFVFDSIGTSMKGKLGASLEKEFKKRLEEAKERARLNRRAATIA
jgi:tRNA(Arg) A34 adenosine deaminase TadA